MITGLIIEDINITVSSGVMAILCQLDCKFKDLP